MLALHPISARQKKEQKLTDPLQILAMAMTQLVLQHGQQIGNDVQPFGQQADALVHFQVTSYGAVDGFELRLGPHQLRAVENGALQVDVDAQDEELADLHVDLAPSEVDGAG